MRQQHATSHPDCAGPSPGQVPPPWAAHSAEAGHQAVRLHPHSRRRPPRQLLPDARHHPLQRPGRAWSLQSPALPERMLCGSRIRVAHRPLWSVK